MKNEANPCIKTVGKWIFKTKVVRHSYRRTSISKFISSSETFHVHYTCEKCGATKTDKFVEKDTLIIMGVSVDELESI